MGTKVIWTAFQQSPTNLIDVVLLKLRKKWRRRKVRTSLRVTYRPHLSLLYLLPRAYALITVMSDLTHHRFPHHGLHRKAIGRPSSAIG